MTSSSLARQKYENAITKDSLNIPFTFMIFQPLLCNNRSCKIVSSENEENIKRKNVLPVIFDTSEPRLIDQANQRKSEEGEKYA